MSIYSTPSTWSRARNRPPDAYPRTRSELHAWLDHQGLQNFNFWKEGPFYAIQLGPLIHATRIRALDRMTFVGWLNFIRGLPT